jgi:hypothetical protein
MKATFSGESLAAFYELPFNETVIDEKRGHSQLPNSHFGWNTEHPTIFYLTVNDIS